MLKKINLLLILLMVLCLSVSVVSAADNDTITISSDNEINLEIPDDSVVDDNLESASYTVNKDNYNKYFDSNGNLLSTVKDGDTINLDGSFSNYNFVVNKQVNIKGTSTNSMKDCTVTIYGEGSGSSINNLNIENTKGSCYGIFVNGASNCVIQGCTIKNTGMSSYALCLGNGANYNNVTDNDFTTYGITYGHGTRSTPPMVISGSHYNYIANNNIQCDDANGIYLSSYDGGPLKGGISNFNIIYNNVIKYNVLPTSWSYGIQIMGTNNTINSNKVIGAYRGISTSNYGNIIINNDIINLTGADYNNVGVEVGGEYAIVGASYSTIRNNTITNAKVIASGSAIYASEYSLVENNYIDVVTKGKGITAGGNSVIIKSNEINTVVGSGVYYKDDDFGLVVDSNKINSGSAIGILIEKESRNQIPSDITVINNIISTTNNYAIDASQANKTYYKIENNKVNKKFIKTPEGELDTSRPEYLFNGNTYTITPENYDDYINANGGLSTSIKDGDILKFQGTFRDKIIYVNSAIKITGNSPVFYNSTFKVTSDGVWIENLKIVNKNANRLNAWGIYVKDAVGVTIANNDIQVYDPNAAYAIYLLDSECVDVLNNKLYSSASHYLTYTLLGISAVDCKIVGNEITTVGTGEVYGYEPEKCIEGNESCLDGNEACADGDEACLDGDTSNGAHVIKEVFRTYGILLIYSSKNNVTNNSVSVSSLLTEKHATIGANGSSNSLVGIDIYFDSNSNIVSNNNVTVKGNDNYIYGLGVLGVVTGHGTSSTGGSNNNQFINNNVVLQGSYFATGFIAGEGSRNTTISGNTFNIVSDNVGYGITLEISQNSNINANNIILNSDIVYGIQGYESNNNIIDNNKIDENAKQAYGIAVSNSNNNKITNNEINADGSGESVDFRNFDSIEGGNAGIYLKSHSDNNYLYGNEITSNKNYAVLIDEVAVNNTVSNNYLKSEKGDANNAVDNTVNNIISDNYVNYFEGSLAKISVPYLEEGTFVLDVGNDANGATVKFYIGDELIGKSNVINGKATLKYVFDKSYGVASYLISAVISKDSFKTETFDSTFEITKGNLIITVDDITVKAGLNAIFKATVKNVLGEAIEGLNVEFYRDAVKVINYYGKAATDKQGIAKANLQTTAGLKATSVIVSVDGNDDYNGANASGKMIMLDLAPVDISIKNIVYLGNAIAILTDNNGLPVSNQLISLKIGTKTYNFKTNNLGEVIFSAVSPGKYNVEISIGDNYYYQTNKASSTVTFKHIITGNKDYSVYYGNSVTYKVRILDASGKAVGAGKVVSIKVGSTTYKVKTDKNGYASKSVKLTAGKYTVTTTYNGFSVSNKITFKATITAKNIVVKKSKKFKFTAKLVDKKGKILKSKKITFKVNGKKYSAKTNKKGVATLTIKIAKVGKNTISSSYGGCTVKNTITVKK